MEDSEQQQEWKAGKAPWPFERLTRHGPTTGKPRAPSRASFVSLRGRLKREAKLLASRRPRGQGNYPSIESTDHACWRTATHAFMSRPRLSLFYFGGPAAGLAARRCTRGERTPPPTAAAAFAFAFAAARQAPRTPRRPARRRRLHKAQRRALPSHSRAGNASRRTTHHNAPRPFLCGLVPLASRRSNACPSRRIVVDYAPKRAGPLLVGLSSGPSNACPIDE